MSKHLLLAVLLPAFLLAGCAGAPADAVTDADDDTGSGADVPFNGADIGYLGGFYDAGDDGLRGIDVDLIEWYAGPDAAAAAKADDPSCPGDCAPPNGYYIRNAEKAPFTFDVANDVRVFLQTRDPNQLVADEEVTYEQFLDTVRDSAGRVSASWQFKPFWIKHEDGVITEIREQFVP